MAFIADDDKVIDQNQDPNFQQGMSTPSTMGQGGSSDVGSNVSTAGVGAGGTGGWTNIQAYLGANKGDTGSAQALDKTVSSQFDNEKNAYTQDSSKFLGDANAKVAADKIDNTQADALINTAKSKYTYGEQTKPQEYQDTVSKVQGALTGEYKGPKEYTYGFGDKTQQYANNLKDTTGGFDQLMGHIYQGAAKQPLSSGQLNLQKQLDVNNENLVNTRQNLTGKYDQMTKDRDQVVQNTTKGLGDVEKQYRVNQNQLKDYLGQQSNRYDTEAKQAESNARSAYNTAYSDTGGHNSSFRQSNLDDTKLIPGFSGPWGFASTNTSPLVASGIWNDNGTGLTWKQLQGEQDFVNTGSTDTYLDDLAKMPSNTSNQYQANQGLLNKFYGEQDDKYKDTADEQERAFNAIQDFLNSNATRKEQGFKVRG